ncbi:MAG: phosphoadenylyl-sulfate reductase [Candidatus Omnitrophota bacterium]
MAASFDIRERNAVFERAKPEEVIAWALGEFRGRLALTSSFGPESGVLLHMASRQDPHIPVLFLDTGFHFKETLDYKKQITRFLGLKNVIDLHADPVAREALMREHGGTPYEKDPDRCCQLHKVEPLDRAIQAYGAWMSGIRRHQTDLRKTVQVIEEYEGGLYKISPLVNFSSREAWWYLKEHKIPLHPLYEKGYLSIGCWPCTRPVQVGDDERSGRWAGRAKTECGIHRMRQKPPAEEKQPPTDLSSNI